MPYMDCYVKNPLTSQNTFREMAPVYGPTPSFEEAKSRLPDPYWKGREDAVECYWKAWKSVFARLKRATPENGFHTNYVDTGYFQDFFMWDTCFCMFYGRYGSRAFDFIRSLDNFYARQHPDGYICRQLSEKDGTDQFHRFEPGGTGPNIMPWPEWEHFRAFNDKNRLEAVFPVLLAYYQWYRKYRTWPDGGYWASGWSCGMDNQPRLGGSDAERMFYHGRHTWIDACLQQILAAKQLCLMAYELGRSVETETLRDEIKKLTGYVNGMMWDEESGFYYDLDEGKERMDVKILGAYWALLAGAVPKERLDPFIAHLERESEFKRLHRIPTLSADHPDYRSVGAYWRGGVWANTNYMAVKGLRACGYDTLAHEIALNHFNAVTEVYKNTGELWENYAPDFIGKGSHSKADYVGWTGLTPICGLIEDVFGIRMEPKAKRVVWDVRITDEFGVANLPYDSCHQLSVKCGARESAHAKPAVRVECEIPVVLDLRWEGGVEITEIPPEEKKNKN